MLRDKNLVPLSHQHQHALALCVRLQRALGTSAHPARSAVPDATASTSQPAAGEHSVDFWQREVQRLFDAEIAFHFEAEETLLFPAAARYDELRPLVRDLLREHEHLRVCVREAREGALGRAGLLRFAETLSGHVHKEERQLFEACQRLLPEAELRRVGSEMIRFFRAAGLNLEA